MPIAPRIPPKDKNSLSEPGTRSSFTGDSSVTSIAVSGCRQNHDCCDDEVRAVRNQCQAFLNPLGLRSSTRPMTTCATTPIQYSQVSYALYGDTVPPSFL